MIGSRTGVYWRLRWWMAEQCEEFAEWLKWGGPARNVVIRLVNRKEEL